VSVLGDLLIVVAVPLVCSACAVDLCVVGGGGFIMGAPGLSCCVLRRFVRC
jgi:hypothetical protein